MSYAVNNWNPVGKTPPDLPKGSLPEPTLGEAVDASITKGLYRRCRLAAQGIAKFHARYGVKTDEEEVYRGLVAQIHTCPEQVSTCPQQAPDFLQVADRELHKRLEEARNRAVDDVIERVLKNLYAVRGEPSREHTLVFHGTPEEFAFFKARLDEWARKRIST